MSKKVRDPKKMKVGGGKKRDVLPNVSKVVRPRKDMLSEKVKGLNPGTGLGNYNLDVMILD